MNSVVTKKCNSRSNGTGAKKPRFFPLVGTVLLGLLFGGANAYCCELTFGFAEATFDTPTRATMTCPRNFPHARGITACETLPNVITGPRPCYVQKTGAQDKVGVLADGPSLPVNFEANKVSGVCCDTPVSPGTGGTQNDVCPPGSIEYDPLPTRNPCAGATTCESPTNAGQLQALVHTKSLICLCGGVVDITNMEISGKTTTIGCVERSLPCVFNGQSAFDMIDTERSTVAFYGIEFNGPVGTALYDVNLGRDGSTMRLDIVNCTFSNIGDSAIYAEPRFSEAPHISINVVNTIFQNIGGDEFAYSESAILGPATVYGSTFQNITRYHLRNSVPRHGENEITGPLPLCLGENFFDDTSADKFSPPSLKHQCAP